MIKQISQYYERTHGLSPDLAKSAAWLAVSCISLIVLAVGILAVDLIGIWTFNF